jgi:ferrous iron transport protein A
MEPMPPDTLLPLEFLGKGEWADVAEVCGDAATVHRLAELGVRSGCRLCVLQPGCPCLLQIGDVRLCLRSHQSTEILVRPLGTREPAA